MEKILEKANYCLHCKIKPCALKGCPLHNNIPEFIQKIKEENYKEAYEILCQTTVLPEYVEEFAHIKNNVKDHV